jgi:putative FmdB family regulatory protein
VPTYSYACTECGHRFNATQAFSDDALTTCPVCSGKLRKVFNSVGVVFKGSGFYRTDSRAAASSGSGEKSTSEPSGTKSGSPEKSGGESSSTPAAPSPAAAAS